MSTTRLRKLEVVFSIAVDGLMNELSAMSSQYGDETSKMNALVDG